MVDSGRKEGVPAFEPLSDLYSLLLSAWEHKFPDADGPASTKPNLLLLSRFSRV